MALGFLVLCRSGYESRSDDSIYYSRVVTRIAGTPVREWIAPTWGENFMRQPPGDYMRDHFAGHVASGAALASLGVPPEHALHVLQMSYQVLTLFLLVWIARQFVQEREAQSLLWGLQLVPVAFTYGVRANHEQGFAFFIVLSLAAGLLMRRHLAWALLVALCCSAILLIKGAVFVLAPVVAAVAFWLHTGGERSARRAAGLGAIGLAGASAAGTALVYESLFRSVAGVGFLAEYWRVQIAERSIAAEGGRPLAVQKLANLSYYLSRALYYSAPWSVLALLAVRRRRRGPSLHELGRDARPAPTFYGVLLVSALAYLAVFSTSDRTASRYVFPVFLLVAAVSVVFFVRNSATMRRINDRIHGLGVHGVAAGIWLLSLLVHLAAHRADAW